MTSIGFQKKSVFHTVESIHNSLYPCLFTQKNEHIEMFLLSSKTFIYNETNLSVNKTFKSDPFQE